MPGKHDTYKTKTKKRKKKKKSIATPKTILTGMY